MANPTQFNSLLVPVDFSAASEAAVERAAGLLSGKDPVLILHHVIDPSLVRFAVEHGWGSADEVTGEMRARAERALEDCRRMASAQDGIEIDAIVSEGPPFLEILRKSEDFAVDAIVIGKFGARGPVEKLLFGSTAEKVLRGSRRPVIVLPLEG
jgi:nucleotide-binding universal stress UspA family protein